MTKVMIAVFRAVVRGLLRPDADTSVTLAQLANVVRELAAVRGDVERHAAEIAEMRRELASGVIGADVAERARPSFDLAFSRILHARIRNAKGPHPSRGGGLVATRSAGRWRVYGYSARA